MVGTGVASFSHFGGVHYQNVDTWEQYVERIRKGVLPINRALPVTDRQLLIREMILQLKLGRIDAGYFRGKFGREITKEFAESYRSLVAEGMATIDGDEHPSVARGTAPGRFAPPSLLRTPVSEYSIHMSLVRTKPLADCASPQEALSELCAGFVGASSLSFDCEEVAAEDLPFPFHFLLVHQKHMTRVLVSHYHSPLDLHVHEQHQVGNLYSRKITLAPAETASIVEYGLVRLDMSYMPQPVRRAILQERAPLGAIMINHHVMRRIQPKWYLRLPPGSELLQWLEATTQPGPLYGRLGTIYCDGEPAVEVLEVVTGIAPRRTNEPVV